MHTFLEKKHLWRNERLTAAQLTDRLPQLDQAIAESLQHNLPMNVLMEACEKLRLRILQGQEPELRSEEHTSELQSRENLVCRLLLEKKNCIFTYLLTNI